MRPRIIGYDIEHREAAVERVAQRRLEGVPLRRRGERKPISSASPDGLRAGALGVSDELLRSEVDRRQVAEVVGVRESVDVGVPAGGGHRHPKVIENRAATDDHLPAGAVRGPPNACRIGEQLKDWPVGHPAPGLAVMDHRHQTGGQRLC